MYPSVCVQYLYRSAQKKSGYITEETHNRPKYATIFYYLQKGPTTLQKQQLQKNVFSSVYVIDITCFDEYFIVHVITGRHCLCFASLEINFGVLCDLILLKSSIYDVIIIRNRELPSLKYHKRCHSLFVADKYKDTIGLRLQARSRSYARGTKKISGILPLKCIL